MFKNRHYFLVLILVLFSAIIIFPDVSTAKADSSFSSGFSHLLDLTTNKTQEFDLNKIKTILDYIDSAEYQNTPDYSGGLKDVPSAYHGYKINSTMGRMLKFCYDSNIPACAVLPEYIRLSSWYKNDTKNNDQSPELWKSLDNFKDPVIIHGSLYLQNTPDVNTGAYYGFDSFKSDILFKYKQKNVFISISKQKDVSEVGKKGFVLGCYKDLNYFYSGKPGLNKIGLGKIKSYLYDGFSISVYIESEKDKNVLQCGTFKWLKGGWAGMNMIRMKHIQKGLERFADMQKNLLESNKFPEYDELVNICTEFNTLSEAKMKKMVGAYFCQLQQGCNSETNCPDMLKNGFNIYDYIGKMSREEMRATLIVDYMKCRLNNIARLKDLKFTLNH